MRPVSKGTAPQSYQAYHQAMNDLRGRIGKYCSYCEQPLLTPEVEHIVPKNPKTGDPEQELDWNNFLLACKNCNATKGNSIIDPEEYLWPDRDNTAGAFVYEEGRINVNCELPEKAAHKARMLLALLGLDRIPTGSEQALLLDGSKYVGDSATKRLGTKGDRWKARYKAWEEANEFLQMLQTAKDRDSMIKVLVKLVVAAGQWSTYAQVFAKEKDVMRHLLNTAHFPGTRHDFFEEREAGFFPKAWESQ